KGDRRPSDLGAVDGHHAVLQGPAHSIDATRVERVQIGDQPVFGGVCAQKGLLLAVKGRNGGYGTKRLLAHDERMIWYTGEHGWTIEERTRLMRPASCQDAGAAGDSIAHMFDLLCNGGGICQRPDVRVFDSWT